VTELLIIGLVAGVMGLDRRGAFQSMISQPVVALPLLGWLLGDVATGAQLGGLVQLLWMSSSLFGANVPPNETVAGLSIGGMVLLFDIHGGDAPQLATWSTAILIGAPVSLAGRWLEQVNDRANLRLARRADAAVRMGRPRIINGLPWWGLFRAFVFNAVLVMTAAALGWGMLRILAPALHQAALLAALTAGMLYMLPAVGLGVTLASVRRRRGVLLAAVVFIGAVMALPV
jgi:mannose/fructose/N-acetylgalactosamine-specific phosphotransferase system component IIC